MSFKYRPKGQGQVEGQDGKDGADGPAKRLRHTRSHSTPNMPALEEALSSATPQSNVEEVKVKLRLRPLSIQRLARNITCTVIMMAVKMPHETRQQS